jgi:hypothetical protein
MKTLAERMTTMRQWLDHQRFEPLTFYSVASSAIRFRVDFANEAEAVAFASAFDGKTVAY